MRQNVQLLAHSAGTHWGGPRRGDAQMHRMRKGVSNEKKLRRTHAKTHRRVRVQVWHLWQGICQQAYWSGTQKQALRIESLWMWTVWEEILRPFCFEPTFEGVWPRGLRHLQVSPRSLRQVVQEWTVRAEPHCASSQQKEQLIRTV